MRIKSKGIDKFYIGIEGILKFDINIKKDNDLINSLIDGDYDYVVFNTPIKFKDNRLRIETYTKEYTFNSGDSFLTGKHYIINPGNVFPFSDDKASIGDDVTYAVAYINTVDNLIRFNRSYKDFLNKEFKKTNLYISDDEDW